MADLKAKIESILFVVARPLNVKRLAEACGAGKAEVSAALDELCAEYDRAGKGVRILRNGPDAQMATAPETARTVQDFLKDETTGEMTKPSLEALTVIAYRGPITKAELEQIRGVNCSLILRNLLMRGLIEASGERDDAATTYRVSMDFVRFLGVTSVEDLPDYGKLHSHESVVRVLKIGNEKQDLSSDLSPAALAKEEALAKGETQVQRPENAGAGGVEDGTAEAGGTENDEDGNGEVKGETGEVDI